MMAKLAGRIKSRVTSHHKQDLVLLIRLMRAAETLRFQSAVVERINPKDSIRARRDLTLAAYMFLGSVGECVTMLRDLSKRGVLRRELLIGHARELRCWDDMTSNPPAEWAKLSMHLRGNHTAHWSLESAEALADAFIQERTISLPLVESLGSTTFENTSFPWAFAVVTLDLFGKMNLLEYEEVDANRRFDEKMQEWVANTAAIVPLLGQLHAKIVGRAGFVIERV